MVKKPFKSVKQLLADYDYKDQKKYVSREFQDYGLRLAKELNDEKHKSLYIKLAKETPRHLLEQAKAFVKDARNVKSKARLFMWKLKDLRSKSKKK